MTTNQPSIQVIAAVQKVQTLADGGLRWTFDAYVYGLRDKESLKYFYVGCTKHNPQERLKDHLYQAVTDTHSNKHFANKVKKIGADNVVCDVLETVPQGEQWIAEKQWIERLLLDGHRLVNRIHNELNYEIGGMVPPTRTQYEWVKKFISNPPPVVSHPVPDIEGLLQELVCEYQKTLEVLTNHLEGLGYEF